jgi:hypothetical protein
MGRWGEKLAEALREAKKYEAATGEQYKGFFEKCGWCWDPNTIERLTIPDEMKEAVHQAAAGSRRAHMKRRIREMVDEGRGEEKPTWEK